MSQLRQNKLTGEWVIYATNRQNRPYDFVRSTSPRERNRDNCPFCPGNEDKTPPPVFQDGDDGEWRIRAFQNGYPAVSSQTEPLCSEPFYACRQGLGRHELVVDTPEHSQTIDRFSHAHLHRVLLVLQERFLFFQKEEGIPYIQIFKNCGADAGMSLHHSHWQITGLAVPSKRLVAYEEQAKAYQAQHGSCLLCDLLAYERQHETRIIAESELFTALVPYASRFPYEIHIVPHAHIESFSALPAAHLEPLSVLLSDMLRRVRALRPDICYNICFMELPHWHIQIYPRIGGFAGFEFATETYINSVLAEDAAERYRGL